jgi:hypothetical protein
MIISFQPYKLNQELWGEAPASVLFLTLPLFLIAAQCEKLYAGSFIHPSK